MNIFSSDYFSPSAWYDYFFQPSSSSSLEDEEPLFLDFDSEVSKSSSLDKQKEFSKLSQADKKAYLTGAIHKQKAALAQLQNDKRAEQAQIKALDQNLSQLYAKREMWVKKQKAIPAVIKKKAPQHVHIDKKLGELDGAIRPVQRKKSSAAQRLLQIKSQIQKAQSTLGKLQSKIASMR